MGIGLYGGYHKSTGPIAYWNRWKAKLPAPTFDWRRVTPDDVVGIYPSQMGIGKVPPKDYAQIQDEVKTFLDKANPDLKRVCIAEELGFHQVDVLMRLSDWMRQTYAGLRVVHNYGYWKNVDNPMAPQAMFSAAQHADEFSLHYYSACGGGTSRDEIRKKFDEYTALDKPMTLTVWASLPKYPGKPQWQYPSAAALIDAEWWQITEANKRGWPIELYAVDGSGGNIGRWYADADAESVKLRSAVYQLLAASGK